MTRKAAASAAHARGGLRDTGRKNGCTAVKGMAECSQTPPMSPMSVGDTLNIDCSQDAQTLVFRILG